MRPTFKLLSDELIKKILSEAREILCKLGVTLHNKEILKMLSDHGAKVDLKNWHVKFTQKIIDQALKTAPKSFKIYDVLGNETHEFGGFNVQFVPGSAAIKVYDAEKEITRLPVTEDFVKFSKLMSRLQNIKSTSTAFIPSDVHEKISDSYRLYLSLLFCEKPVVTGAFTIEAFGIMRDLQLAVRGSKPALKKKPLCVFSCCPTSPLKWSDVTSQNLVDCAKHGIPVEYISMPLFGFIAPVTLVGSLIQHTAETLSGVILSQLTAPGTPILYGGSPAQFDIRYETTPMGAIETQMVDCAYNEIGKFLKLPTQAYIALSDANLPDAQAGSETGIGAVLAALSGINSISGPGMLDFESCQSLEKLVIDNEICGSALRLTRGIEPREDFPAIPLFEELLRDKHLLISKHTRKYLKDEQIFPGPVMNRANFARWKEEGELTLMQRAQSEVKKHLQEYTPSRLSKNIKLELTRLMTAEAKKYGMKKLPKA
ncbi:MAG: trimethylamine methyltransferase family protein [Candidatus Wallbacteria bacterium]|nr:trimethylamine methyltransferase family protein [Candidatus Wallbacteria bacterium]